MSPDCPMVYFIQNRRSKAVKIGFSWDPEARLKQLQTGSDDALVLLGTTFGFRDSEAVFHRKFAEHRTSGEWFDPDPELLQDIEYWCSAEVWDAHGFAEVPYPWVAPLV